MDPPEVEWERVYFPGYYSTFKSITETSDGGFAATITVAAEVHYAFYRLDTDGNILWAARSELDNQGGRVVKELQNNDFAVAGFGRETPSSSSALMLGKYSSTGQEIWTKLYNSPYPGSEVALSFDLLPDGGFAVCGEIDPVEGMNQAWILRTDSQGDTLWTREWGWQYNDKAVSVLCIDNGLTVLMHGNTPTTPGGPHLVRYDMDGNLLWETDIPEWPGTVAPHAQAMCEASDGGLLLMDNYWPAIMHTDYLGNPDWWFWPPGASQPYGYSLSTTMDGGILYGGKQTEVMGNDPLVYCGVISRHDSHGDLMWYDNVFNSSCNAIYSVRQLSQGGYIAAGTTGSQGFLMKYAPELGIEIEEPLPVISLDISPNPFSSGLCINFDIPEPAPVELSVFDLSGRLIENLISGSVASGEHLSVWNPGASTPAGCYIVKLSTPAESQSVRCVYLK